jgi:2-dehydropantoate 2-reductase
MAKGVREGFVAVRALGGTVTPFPLRVLFAWMPQWFVVAYWRRFFASDMADYVFGRHARSASREMREIASDCLTLLDKSGVEAPALHQLY